MATSKHSKTSTETRFGENNSQPPLIRQHSLSKNPENIKSSGISVDRQEWLKFATEQPSLACCIEKIARSIEPLQEDLSVPDSEASIPWIYVERLSNRIPRLWENKIGTWTRDLRSGDISVLSCEFQIKTLNNALEHLDHKCADVLEHMCPDGLPGPQIEEWEPVPQHTTWSVDERRTLSTALQLKARLRRVQAYLQKSLNEGKKDMSAEKEITVVGKEQDQLRKRRGKQEPSPPSSKNDGQGDDVLSSSGAAEHHWTRSATRILETLESKFPHWTRFSRKALLNFALDQNSLWSIAVAFGILSGIAVAISVMQSRPQVCMPTFGQPDDGTWALVAQVFVQIFSLYATLLPIIRDKNLSVQSFWFSAMLTISAVASVISPIVYGVSWQASTLLSYCSGVCGMIAGAQLAGSIKDAAAMNDLAR